MNIPAFALAARWARQLRRPSRWLPRWWRPPPPGRNHAATAAEIRSTMGVLERSFRAITENLEPLTHHTRSLVQQSEQLLSLASGQSDGQTIFHDAVAVLNAPLTHVDFCLSRQQQQFDLLRQSELKTGEVLACQHQMQEALKPLTYMIVLFKIESASLPPEQQDTFHTVAQEIQRLRELVDSTFQENIETLRRSLRTLAAVRDKLNSDYETHGKFVAAHRGNIDSAIQTLDQQLDANNRHDLRLRSVSQDLDREVGSLVVALQFQDILHQKCEHVLTALQQGATSASGRWTRVQAAQMQAVSQELEQAVGILDGGLRAIEQHTAKLDAASVALDQFDSMTAAADGMVQQLLDNLHDVGEIISAATKLADESWNSIAPVLGLTRNLSSTIGEISININHIALNAQVRSVQIGSGSGLEVLAARTADISHELAALGEKTAVDIRALAGMLESLLANFDEFRQRGQKEISHLETQGKGVEQRLHAMRNHTLEAMATVDLRVKNVRTATTATKEELHRLPEASARLLGMSRTLLEAVAAQEEHEGFEDEIESHARSYTMASERQVHATILGHDTAADSAAADPELFVDTSPAPDSEPTGTGNRTELRTPPGRPHSAALSPAAPAVSTLGDDNIEMF